MSDSDSLGLRYFVVTANIKALKKALTADQMAVYKEAIRELKDEFKKNHPELSADDLEFLDARL